MMNLVKRRIFHTAVALWVLFLGVSVTAQAQDGKALFSANCASCHAVHKNLTGPALYKVQERWPDEKMLYAWIRNNQQVIKSGYPRALEVYNQYNKVSMNLFPNLKDEEIGALLKYINSVPPPSAGTNNPSGAENPSAAGAAESDNLILYGVLTLILAIVALILLQVNSNLKKLADDKDGVPSLEPLPFWRNKTYIALTTIVLFLVGGYLTTKGAIGLGRTKNYQPEQPIYYSHKVHAGTNQINCQYCHSGANEGKHANIPSVNVCMNCHMAITEYAGEKLYNGDGEEVDGTREIQKLFKYAGFEAGKPWDASKARPIAWTQIHNLPDHVYFNHSQHVKAGQVACQTCHGEIQKMGEVYQYADLSMGWCINCHRETKVQFKENGFYSIYEKYHNDLKNGHIDSTKGITVEKIGGTECQKCHY